jgi:hypothetical protein
MHRLRCGIIYTNAFADYLARLELEQREGGARQILALDYLRCGTGEQSGSAWWKVEWLPEHRAPEDCRFTIGQVPVCLSRQSQRGLKHRCIDWRDGSVVIRS